MWIGYGAIILSGVHIGKGAVIGAGCVVSKNVDPYEIVVGNPMRTLKKRFSDDIISELMGLDYGLMNEMNIKDNINYFYSDVNSQMLKELKKKLMSH